MIHWIFLPVALSIGFVLGVMFCALFKGGK